MVGSFVYIGNIRLGLLVTICDLKYNQCNNGQVNLNCTTSLKIKNVLCILYEIHVQANYLYIIRTIFI